MTVYQVRYTQRGEHVHCRVFAANQWSEAARLKTGTWALVGNLIFRDAEWRDFVEMMKSIADVQIKHEDEP